MRGGGGSALYAEAPEYRSMTDAAGTSQSASLQPSGNGTGSPVNLVGYPPALQIEDAYQGSRTRSTTRSVSRGPSSGSAGLRRSSPPRSDSSRGGSEAPAQSAPRRSSPPRKRPTRVNTSKANGKKEENGGFMFPAFSRNKSPTTPQKGLPEDWLQKVQKEFQLGDDLGPIPGPTGDIIELETVLDCLNLWRPFIARGWWF